MTSPGVEEVRNGLSRLLPRLWRFALYLTRDNITAEDLVQSTCLRALEKASQYTANTKLDSWTFTIMASIWKNSRRAASKTNTETIAEIDAIPFDGVDIAELNIFAQQVLKEITKLPDGQRAVVALVCVEGWSYKEAAETLGTPIGTIMSRLANARKALAHLKNDAQRGGVRKGADKS